MKSFRAIPLVVILFQVGSSGLRAQDVQGPVPSTPSSYPMMASDHLFDPLDLSEFGYVEEEYFVSGDAGVYAFDASGVPVRSGDEVAYTTRILVRRPAAAAVSSGNVIVELPNTARNSDAAFVWALSSQYLMGVGDIWVGITFSPAVIDALRAFDPDRYASLSFPNPRPTQACGRGAATSDSEEGLRWDAIADIASLLRSGEMLGGIEVERIYAAAHQADLETWVGTFHNALRRSGGEALFDAYVIHRDRPPAALGRCGPAGKGLADADSVDVPVIRIVAEGDVVAALGRRRPDSDRYRLYEVAGAPHADASFYTYMPTLADQQAVGTTPLSPDWPFDYECTPPIALTEAPMMRYVANAAFMHLDAWVRDGIAPPHAERVVVDTSREQPAIVRDRFGNATGGVRTPQMEVPTVTYVPKSEGPGACGNLLHTVPLVPRAVEATFGDADSFRRAFVGAVDRLEAERWLTPMDARELRESVDAAP